jgi:hypothetical protein
VKSTIVSRFLLLLLCLSIRLIAQDNPLPQPTDQSQTVENKLKLLAQRWGWDVDLASVGRLDRLMEKFGA